MDPTSFIGSNRSVAEHVFRNQKLSDAGAVVRTAVMDLLKSNPDVVKRCISAIGDPDADPVTPDLVPLSTPQYD